MSVFDRYYKRYDSWYDRNKFAYLSEVEAVKKMLPKNGKGLEVGVGTGRFAAPLGIEFGIDPSRNMIKIAKVLEEAARVLKRNGRLIVGIIDKDSFLGKHYQKKKSIFYKLANFFSVEELINLLKKTGFGDFSYYQTLFTFPEKMSSVKKPQRGFGKGGFVLISGGKR